MGAGAMKRWRRLVPVLLVFAGLVVAPPAVAVAAETVTVTLEPGQEKGLQPNWVSVRTVVSDAVSGAGVTEGYEVFVSGQAADGARTDDHNLAPQNEEGVFAGFVIVPKGGSWTFSAAVLTKRAEGSSGVPTTHASATMTLDVVAGALESGGEAAAAGDQGPGGGGNSLEAAVLWLHSLFGLAWVFLIAVVAMIGHPRGRKALSENGLAWLELRLSTISRGLWWLAGAVTATGIYNTLESTPYETPFSPDRVGQVFDLPYGRAYFLTLAAKVAVYGVMLTAAVPMLARAQRAAGLRAGAPSGTGAARLETIRSPWPARTLSPAGVAARGGGGGEAGPGRGDASPSPGRPATPDIVAGPPPRVSPVPAITLLGGAAWISLAVTLLKFFHILSEASR